ncbi:hypothetical protein Emin_1074 [Elusimicrobium minutum Pei191]|uniref:Uncharacterized protein n=1 Tax=Elusimicrobium minutum (strain Pei191) TaxID=445932 RepID=B2KDN0_ELUMP|nr:hypothetical protein [Elusimicrobium minutum]ACC98626.1 hypothetical protein Emin_1074 [Elusimicrobium minutum Pei191]
MIKKILNFFVPSKLKNLFSGLQNFLSGKKTYIAAAIIMLEALLMFVEQLTGINGVTGLVDFIKNIASNEAFIRFAEALAVFGIRAALPSVKRS